MLDGVFAFCLVDTLAKKVYLARDTFGVRPLFKSMCADGVMTISSEAKGLMAMQKTRGSELHQFRPGFVETFSLRADGKVRHVLSDRFHSIGTDPQWMKTTTRCFPLSDDIYSNVRTLLTEAVRKRLVSERRIGCMLSGGLDSSIIAALVCKLCKESDVGCPVQTFSVGTEGSPDIAAARKVASYIGSEHHEVIFTPEEGIQVIEESIYHLESYDVIAVRASIGMYLLSKYIKEVTDSVVIFSGEGSDAVTHGHIYFNEAPTPEAANQQSHRLMNDLYMYSILRADRMTAAFGLELRVPFLDHQFTSFYSNLDPSLKQPRDGCEKFLLREAFNNGLLPDDILWRQKEGLSDGLAPVRKSWYMYLQEYIEDKVTNSQLETAKKRFPFDTPLTKESYYYREVVEKYYHGNSHWIPYMYTPKWVPSCKEPSARCLSHYKYSADTPSK